MVDWPGGGLDVTSEIAAFSREVAAGNVKQALDRYKALPKAERDYAKSVLAEVLVKAWRRCDALRQIEGGIFCLDRYHG